MQLQAEHANSVLKLGTTLAAPEAKRAVDMVRCVSPFSHLTVDFTRVHECQDAAFVQLIRALKQLVDVVVDLQGTTQHQKHLLKDLEQGTYARAGMARSA